MFKGEIVETGTSDQVCDAPQHPYTQKLLSAVPDIDAALA
jgi:oligopeptide/dipeptide ABC transporter ATP-binding protein